jgi:hypothetical protein
MKLIDLRGAMRPGAFNAEGHESTKATRKHEIVFGEPNPLLEIQQKIFVFSCRLRVFVFLGLRKHVPGGDDFFYGDVDAVRDRREMAHLSAFARFVFAVEM